jgi:hypothetical protein
MASSPRILNKPTERCAGLKAEQRNRGGDRELEEIGGRDLSGWIWFV